MGAKSRESCWGSKNSWHHRALCYSSCACVKGEQKSLLFRPCSIYPPWYDPQRLAREHPTPLCCLGEPKYWGLPKKRGGWSTGAALGRLQSSCYPFLVLWHHPVAAGRGLSLPCHHHVSPCSPVPQGPGDGDGPLRISSHLAGGAATWLVAQPGPPGRRSPGHCCHLQTEEEHREGEGEPGL